MAGNADVMLGFDFGTKRIGIAVGNAITRIDQVSVFSSNVRTRANSLIRNVWIFAWGCSSWYVTRSLAPWYSVHAGIMPL